MHAFGLRPSGFLDKILCALYITLMRAMFAKVHSVFDMHLTSHKFRKLLISRITIKHVYIYYVIYILLSMSYKYRPESDIRLCIKSQKGSKSAFSCDMSLTEFYIDICI
jgi:hypothetical protein